MTQNATEKLLYLESIRGIAAIIVALLHADFILKSPLTQNHFVRQGDLMVDLFFVLSGFVISYNYYNKIFSTTNLMVFQARRFLRLYPLHLITLLAFIGIETIQWIYEQKTGILGTATAFKINNFSALINNIFLTHAFFENSPTFNSPSWSISTEFYTYLIFAISILTLTKDYSRRLFFLISITASGVVLYSFDASGNTTGLSIIRCIYSFFIGCFTWSLVKNSNTKLPIYIQNILFLLIFLSFYIHDLLASQIYPLLFGTAIFSLYKSPEGALKKILNNSKLVFLGTISYGIYMWHSAVWLFIILFSKHIIGIKQISLQNNKLYLDINTYLGITIQITGLFIIILISWLSYKFVEAPINNYRHNLPFK
jgi:peptidoglycan/LPS O-acetylase OafA/YrhL